MAIKETPVTYHTYYKSLREHVGKERQSYVDRLTSVTKERDELYKQVKDNIEVYRDFGVNPLDFKEFRENKFNRQIIKDSHNPHYHHSDGNIQHWLSWKNG